MMSAGKGPHWSPDALRADALQAGNLRVGAQSWVPESAPRGPLFPGLTAAQAQDGHTFVTLCPTMHVVPHPDHVRAVWLTLLGPEPRRVSAVWLSGPQTLARPGFDAAAIAAFAQLVLDQHGDATEMNPRGLRSAVFTGGRLMPQEFDIECFHPWVLVETAEGDAT